MQSNTTLIPENYATDLKFMTKSQNLSLEVDKVVLPQTAKYPFSHFLQDH